MHYSGDSRTFCSSPLGFVAWGAAVAILQLWVTTALGLSIDQTSRTTALVLGALALGGAGGGALGTRFDHPRASLVGLAILAAMLPLPIALPGATAIGGLVGAAAIAMLAWAAFAAACPGGVQGASALAWASAGAALAGPVALSIATSWGLAGLRVGGTMAASIAAILLASARSAPAGQPVRRDGRAGARPGRAPATNGVRDVSANAALRWALVDALAAGAAGALAEITILAALRLTAGSSLRSLVLTTSGLWLAGGVGALVGRRAPSRRTLGRAGAVAAVLLIPVLGALPLWSIPLQSALWNHPMISDGALVATVAVLIGLPALAGSAIVARSLAMRGSDPARIVAMTTAGNIVGLVLGIALGRLLGLTAPLAAAAVILATLPLARSLGKARADVGTRVDGGAGGTGSAWGSTIPACRRAMANLHLLDLARLGVGALRTAPGLALIGAIAVTMFLPWNPTSATCGPFLYASILDQISEQSGRSLGETVARFGRVVFWRPGLDGCVAVRREPTGTKVLLIDGKPDAATLRDMATQRLLGHVPMLLHRDPRRALVIGLGSGVTLGSVLAHDVRAVDVMEISRGVMEATRYFAAESRDPLSDPRVAVSLGDARALLRDSHASYDVIASEPSNPWVAGSGALFTRQFFESAARRLNTGGLFAQWIPAYQLGQSHLEAILAAFARVFPHMMIVESVADRDYILLGAQAPMDLDYDRIEKRMHRGQVAEDLAELEIRDTAGLWARVRAHQCIAGALEGVAPLVDGDLGLELTRPLEHLSPPRWFLSLAEPPPVLKGQPEGFAAAIHRRGRILKALAQLGDRDKKGAEATLALARREAFVAGESPGFLKGFFLAEAYAMEEEQDLSGALAAIDADLKLLPDDPDLWNERAKVFLLEGRARDAADLLRGLLAAHPGHRQARVNLSIAMELLGNDDEAEAALYQALRQAPNDPQLRARAAHFHALRGQERWKDSIIEGLALSGDLPMANGI